jgi:predicted glycosyltransferase
LIRSFQPDLLVGLASPSLGWSGKAHRVPAALFLDAEPPGRTARRVYRLAHTTVTPASYRGTIRGRHVTYPGYPELAYLHPARFEPDPDRAAGFGVHPSAPYTVVRFTSWDTGRNVDARTLERRSRIVESLRGRTRVAILGDDQALPGPLQADRITGRVADVHHLIAFASLVVVDSPRVAAEAAVLGTPAVHLSAGSCGYADNIAARYGLITHLQPHAVEAAVDTFERYLTADRGEWTSARARLLDEQTDVTAWMADFFERFTKG